VYDGTALPDRVGDARDEPARILVYRLPLVDDFPERAALRREVRITVLHEIAHHFGLDEDRLDDLGYG
jgi:predicted Zn-dependent protease with MMP-like domain